MERPIGESGYAVNGERNRDEHSEEGTTEGGKARCVGAINHWIELMDGNPPNNSFAFFTGLLLAFRHTEYAMALTNQFKKLLEDEDVGEISYLLIDSQVESWPIEVIE